MTQRQKVDILSRLAFTESTPYSQRVQMIESVVRILERRVKKAFDREEVRQALSLVRQRLCEVMRNSQEGVSVFIPRLDALQSKI